MQNVPMETDPCTKACEYLAQNEVETKNENQPPGAASWYIPMQWIKTLLQDEPDGLTLEKIFLCPCNRCQKDGGSVDDRSASFNAMREYELRHDYAAIYALLIYINRPGLIRIFQKHELKLSDSRYLREEDFQFLRKEQITGFEALRSRILRDQYSFLVRTLMPRSDIVAIPSKELLPINEDPQPKGEGTFAVVYGFGFQHDEYRSKDFGQITRFARKVFKRGMSRAAAKEWYNLQCLSKADHNDHLMPALSAYLHGDIFFILQEEAELSLHDYLQDRGEKYQSDELWKQMSGVADGLDTLHRVYKGTKIAYHRDLKPANILIVRGILKIADFGLLEFKPIPLGDTGSGVVNDNHTGYYAAPRQGRYTREDDIWSLACVMSELATSDVQGRAEVVKYKNARMASCPSGRDTPRFFWQQNVKAHVLDRHELLQQTVQTGESAGPDCGISRFQMKFYNAEFFALLNSMFRQKRHISNLLEVSSHFTVPDAGQVARTIENLRQEATSEPPPDVQNGCLISELEIQSRHNEDLTISMEKSLEDFKASLDNSDERKFQRASLAECKKFLTKLQEKQAQERRQQALKRLAPFIEAFEKFGQFVDELCGSNNFMAFIWGPFRFLLETASTDVEALNTMLDLYRQIGLYQPPHSRYAELFKRQPEMVVVLAAVYRDIIQVQKHALQFFKQPMWRGLFATTWTRYRSRFSGRINHMASRLDLLANSVNILDFNRSQDSFVAEDEHRRTEMEIEDLSRRQAIYPWLKSIDMESEQHHFERIRRQHPSTGSWLLENATFKEWFDPQGDTPSVLLWLHGNPGVGKTILASMVIQEARKLSPSPTTLFFYFKQGDTARDNFRSMAHTLLAQLLKQDSGIFDYVYNRCCTSAEELLTSRVLIEELLVFALRNCESAYIVLDGLDECGGEEGKSNARQERKRIVEFFRDMIENTDPNSSDPDRIRCLFVSRKDSARKDFNGLPDIPVTLENNENDIDEYNYTQSQNLGVKFGISSEKMKEIAGFVSAFAEGVFLVAELVWINLCGQTSVEGLERERQSLPTGLDDKLAEVYARIIQLIKNKPVRAERDDAMMILRWLTCAKRPLKLHEVQTMKSINLAKRAVEFEARRFRVGMKDLCESLVDVREDGTVELVHLTAKLYLSKKLDIAAEDVRMSTLCIDYLNLPVFSNPPCRQDVLDGNYGFMEYAILNWVRHLEAGLSSGSAQDTWFQELFESLEVLLELHWKNPTVELKVPKRTLDTLDMFKGSENFVRIQQVVVSTKEQISRFGDMHPEERALDFTEVVLRIRTQLESLASDNIGMLVTKEWKLKYGSNVFKCPRFSCKYFTHGFYSKGERERHLERHERPARCTDTNCTGFIIGFANEAQLTRHLRETHLTALDQDQSFPTDEEVTESLAEPAPETPIVPDESLPPEPATEPGSESESPVTTLTQATRQHRPTKRARVAQDLNCQHCGKNFKKKYNLQSHLKTHGIGQTFTCEICSAEFGRKSDLTRHITALHSNEKAFKCGGFLLSGQPWGCGQSFARADILRSHHKTKKGKKCIAPREQEEQGLYLQTQE